MVFIAGKQPQFKPQFALVFSLVCTPLASASMVLLPFTPLEAHNAANLPYAGVLSLAKFSSALTAFACCVLQPYRYLPFRSPLRHTVDFPPASGSGRSSSRRSGKAHPFAECAPQRGLRCICSGCYRDSETTTVSDKSLLP